MDKKFPSKIGFLMLIPIVLLLALPIALITSTAISWPSFLTLLSASFFFMHLLLTTNYLVTGSNLKIRSGFIYKLDVDVSIIKKINKSNSIFVRQQHH